MISPSKEAKTASLRQRIMIGIKLFEHTVFGYLFFTLFHAIGPMIWFYPLNELELSGYEVFVVALFSPIFLSFPGVWPLCSSKWGTLGLRIGMVCGILSFQAPTTFARLFLLTTGNSLAMLHLVTQLNCANTGALDRKLRFWGHILGYFAVLASRIAYRTIALAWSDTETNGAIAALGLATCLSAFILPDLEHYIEEPPAAAKEKAPANNKPNALFAGLAFGSHLFMMQWVFAEVSVPCRWVNEGYPDPGPAPVPWGAGVLVSLAFGIHISHFHGLIIHPTWSALGVLSFYTMYYVSGFGGYFAACVLAIYVASLWPNLLNLFAQASQPHAALFAVFAYLVQIFYSVWTVAYNFVPGGVYTREFTGALIGCCCACVAMGVLWHSGSLALIGVNHIAFSKSVPCNRFSFSHVKLCVKVFAVFGVSILLGRYTLWRPLKPEVNLNTSAVQPTDLNVMLWTYHFGYDNQGWPSLERTVSLVRNLRADVIGLLETDASKPFMGSNDLGQWLGERLNYHVDFGPSTRTHTWGSMLLSKYPIKSSWHHLLPSPEGELAPALVAVLDLGQGKEMGVVLSHMGNDRDDLDRKLQADYLANQTRMLVYHKIPTVFIGYVTSHPGSRDYKQLIQLGNLKDIDPSDRDRFCEYVFYNKMMRLSYARVSHGGLTDTEVQIGRFRVYPWGTYFEDHEKVVLEPENVEPSQRFSPVFGEYFKGHYSGKRHHYHMGTPKYFVEITKADSTPGATETLL